MSIPFRHLSLVAGAAFAAILHPAQLSAQVALPKIFSDHMVLQRDRPIHIWGWAAPKETILIKLAENEQRTIATTGGTWAVDFAPRPASTTPIALSVTASNALQFHDILIGDVWIASGQSNMELLLKGSPTTPILHSQEEIAAANQPLLRLFMVGRATSTFPLDDFSLPAAWTTCTPQTAADFSAIAYLFGREISEKLQVPIGLVDSTWGGTPAEAWVSLPGLTRDGSLITAFDEYNELAGQRAALLHQWALEDAVDRAARARGETVAPRSRSLANLDSHAPAMLYNAMIAPIVPMHVRGVIWYQGEANSTFYSYRIYDKLFPGLINDWRRDWKDPDLPFLFVQLANYNARTDKRWAVLREAQRTTLALAHTGMAVAIDVGEANNIHPADKPTVAHRLALAARAQVYGEALEFSGPLFQSTSVQENRIFAWFTHADGMHTRGRDFVGWEIAGADHAFIKPAQISVSGNAVVLADPRVPQPAYVRYGWDDNPATDLYNSANLPASPFTSDDPHPFRPN